MRLILLTSLCLATCSPLVATEVPNVVSFYARTLPFNGEHSLQEAIRIDNGDRLWIGLDLHADVPEHSRLIDRHGMLQAARFELIDADGRRRLLPWRSTSVAPQPVYAQGLTEAVEIQFPPDVTGTFGFEVILKKGKWLGPLVLSSGGLGGRFIVELGPPVNDADALWLRQSQAAEALAREEWGSAETACRKLLAIDPESVTGLSFLAETLHARGRRLDEIHALDQAIRISERDGVPGSAIVRLKARREAAGATATVD
jgi:hypothetical protein